MARPLVLGRTDHPTIWTPVYADVTDPKMTDWLWEQRESEEQKERFLMLHSRKKFFNAEERDRRFVKKQRKSHDQSGDLQEYRLMTSVSMPVFDRRENAVRSSFRNCYVRFSAYILTKNYILSRMVKIDMKNFEIQVYPMQLHICNYMQRHMMQYPWCINKRFSFRYH